LVNGIMPPRLETDRLILRPFTLDDIDDAYTILETHPDVWKFDPGFQRTHAQRAGLVERYVQTNDENGCGTLAMTLKQSGVFVGYIGLQTYCLSKESLSADEVELFYKLGWDYWGRGYAFEACKEILRYAFEELHLARVITATNHANEPSLRLLRRLGMHFEKPQGNWPHDLMGILENPHTACLP
jgi:3-dehydroquinate dehydratase / shikimate dehydrogenase